MYQIQDIVVGEKKKGAPTRIQTQTLWLTTPGSLPSDYMKGVN